MSRRPSDNPTKLRIWQQNARKSIHVTHCILQQADPEKYDIIAIQEPYLDDKKRTRASPYWHVHYPTNHLLDGQARSRSLFLININISSDSYDFLQLPHSDFTGIRFRGDFGSLSIINVYNEITTNDSLTALTNYFAAHELEARPTEDDHMVWLGDFNRHHESWEPNSNSHLFSSPERINPLLELLYGYGMVMTLPPESPTLQAPHRSYHP